MTPTLQGSTLRVQERAGQPVAAGRRWILGRPYASAVIVPPMALYLATLAAVVLVASLFAPAAPNKLVLRSALIAALHLPLCYVLTTTTRGLLDRGFAGWTFVPDAVLLLILLECMVPGFVTPWPVQALIVAASLIVQPLAAAWRRVWEQFDDVNAALVVPDPDSARAAMHRLSAIPHLHITNILVPDDFAHGPKTIEGRPVSTETSALLAIDKKAIVSNAWNDSRVNAAVAQLVARGYEIASESSLLRAAEGRIDSDLANPLNLLLGRSGNKFVDAISRLMDLALAIPLLLLLSPVLVLVALLIKLDSKGPVLFTQLRLGKGGRPFRVVKFRSMYTDAEARSGPVWATEDDPRITRLGRILRKLRVDELPQLLNVIGGQMALVGPRPERAHFFRRLRVDIPMFELRTAVKPGITGWAQIRAPYAASADDARVKLNYDLYYAWRRSPWFDVAILFDTITVAFGGRGAR